MFGVWYLVFGVSGLGFEITDLGLVACFGLRDLSVSAMSLGVGVGGKNFVFKSHGLLYPSSLGVRVIKKRERS